MVEEDRRIEWLQADSHGVVTEVSRLTRRLYEALRLLDDVIEKIEHEESEGG